MKKINFGIFIVCMALLGVTQLQAGNDTTGQLITRWLVAGPVKVVMPVYADEKDLHGKTLKPEEMLKYTYKEVETPEAGKLLIENAQWRKEQTDKQGNLKRGVPVEGTSMVWQAVQLHVPEFVNIEFTVTTGRPFEFYLDNRKKLSSYSYTKKSDKIPEKEKSIALEPGIHLVMIKSLITNDTTTRTASIKVAYRLENKVNEPPLFDLSANQTMDIDHLLHGQRLSSVSLSPDARYYILHFSQIYPPEGKREHWSELYDARSGKMIQSFRHTDISKIEWVPKAKSISYTAKRGNDTFLLLMDLKTLAETELMKLPKQFDSYRWAPTGEFILYSVNDKLKRDPSGVYKMEGMPDRWPWYRRRGQLYIFRVSDRSTRPLTHGHLTCQLQDISHNGRFVLFSQSVPQYSERPYFKQYMMQLELTTMHLDTLWEQNFAGRAQYSPDDNQLLVTGSAAMFDKAGANLKKGKFINDYDTQAYIFDIKSGMAHPITKQFNPSVKDAQWSRTDGNIYMLTEDRTYKNIWRYTPEADTFDLLPAKVDVIDGFKLSNSDNTLVYWGSSISYPTTGWLMNLNRNDQKLICDSEKAFFEHVTFGKTAEWTFKNKKGRTIDGRIYYPPHFDSNKKYPLIVYYYGGTIPTSRSFRGRYPKNLFAAHGYVVYVLQPSGATGYGQDFSALHVNGWGKENASDIIEGTKKFLEQHPFIDRDAVGCIGASYGGYMTMYLQTQTNIFSAAIAHAGISSISSYWGEGYWGYLYSSVASANSFPWNNKKLYVDHSPLFKANKMNTPLLLLHGTSDTNVPVGESIQLYTALKLLGKPVELVEIEGQDHHIVDYKKRIRWQKTILAWFDKHLKKAPDWWKSLYPDKNL